MSAVFEPETVSSLCGARASPERWSALRVAVLPVEKNNIVCVAVGGEELRQVVLRAHGFREDNGLALSAFLTIHPTRREAP